MPRLICGTAVTSRTRAWSSDALPVAKSFISKDVGDRQNSKTMTRPPWLMNEWTIICGSMISPQPKPQHIKKQKKHYHSFKMANSKKLWTRNMHIKLFLMLFMPKKPKTNKKTETGSMSVIEQKMAKSGQPSPTHSSSLQIYTPRSNTRSYMLHTVLGGERQALYWLHAGEGCSAFCNKLRPLFHISQLAVRCLPAAPLSTGSPFKKRIRGERREVSVRVLDIKGRPWNISISLWWTSEGPLSLSAACMVLEQV